MNKKTKTRLITLLYLLMRDELPTGKICEKINCILENDIEAVFSNIHLEEMAKEYVERLNSV